MGRTIAKAAFSVFLVAGLALLPAAPAAAADTNEELTFFDSLAFDKSLADTLAKQPDQAVIVPSGPFSPNQLPPRLEKWLSVVSKTGGSVKLKKESNTEVATRGVLSDVVELSVKARQDAELEAIYTHAKAYNVLVTFNGNDVTAIQFIKRPTDTPAPAK
jgi:hypothetical protein